jgi:tetrahydromethanopterin S-methyltransferase subunit G
MPRVGRMHKYPRILHSIEYSAHGVAKAALAGRLVAEVYYSTSNHPISPIPSPSAIPKPIPATASNDNDNGSTDGNDYKYVMSPELAYLSSLPSPPQSMPREPVRWLINNLIKFNNRRALARGGEYVPLNFKKIMRDSAILAGLLVILLLVFISLVIRMLFF